MGLNMDNGKNLASSSFLEIPELFPIFSRFGAPYYPPLTLISGTEDEGMEAGPSTKVVSFGHNFNGQLGYDGYDNKTPRSVNTPPTLITVQAGWSCSAALTSTPPPSCPPFLICPS